MFGVVSIEADPALKWINLHIQSFTAQRASDGRGLSGLSDFWVSLPRGVQKGPQS